jgi:hypothetical protein
VAFLNTCWFPVKTWPLRLSRATLVDSLASASVPSVMLVALRLVMLAVKLVPTPLKLPAMIAPDMLMLPV